MSHFALDKVGARFPDAILERYVDRPGDPWAVLRPESIRDVASHLKNDPALDFRLFVTLECVDRLQLPTNKPRFEIFFVLRSLTRNEHVRLKTRVDEEKAELPSLTPVFQGANWAERFVWDFYGVRFLGHPDLRRILLYDEFKGHPLRKDYGLRERQPLIPERPIQDLFRGPGTSGVA